MNERGFWDEYQNAYEEMIRETAQFIQVAGRR